ncbi:hypothetical protein Nepgr_009049 [Nepenthes gracilis]|uniref:Uncharacterized protein n=1 Tax=Nepenthes gracilis TaxID=150966 RepID=A0AAD3SAP9_NEPGR|nr:hypothetical protein Nepgr_009049 [Nepenthes gracilis]
MGWERPLEPFNIDGRTFPENKIQKHRTAPVERSTQRLIFLSTVEKLETQEINPSKRFHDLLRLPSKAIASSSILIFPTEFKSFPSSSLSIPETSALQYSEAMNARDIHIWDNAAFDNGELEYSTAFQFPWSTAKPLFLNLSESPKSDSSTKENHSPFIHSPHSTESSARIKPLHDNSLTGNTLSDQSRPSSKQEYSEKVISEIGNQEGGKENRCSERNIDSEIEVIEKEINRLSSRLEALRLEKVQRNAKSMEKRGKLVPAKFMEPRQKTRILDGLSKFEESITKSAKPKTLNRGVSMGPSEIIRGARRGISLGPAEIFSASKSKQLSKQEMVTPIPPSQSRRKSCFWKLQDIDEVKKVKNERGKSLSLSPNSRKSTSKLQASKQVATTTVVSKKFAKKEDGIVSSIQPKNLFKDGEKSVPAKKPFRNGRFVASRYNQTNGNSAINDLRKRSLPENEKEEGKRCDKKPASLAGKSTENRIKKRWEIPSEANTLVDNTPVTKMLDLVPKIRTARCINESPRDSGPAKRVSELIGRRSFFSMDDNGDDAEPSVFQAFSFAEGEVVKESYPITRTFHCIDEIPQDPEAAKKVAELIRWKSLFDYSDDDDLDSPTCQVLRF